MRKMNKHLLIFLMVLMLAVSLCSVAAFGADEEQGEAPVLVRFDIPEGWSSMLDIDALHAGDVAALNRTGEYVDVTIHVFCVDVYGNTENPSMEREEVNNDWFTFRDIAEMYPSVSIMDSFNGSRGDVDEDAVSMKTYGGQEYFVISNEEFMRQYYTVLRYENGIKYEFRLGENMWLSSDNMEDFEAFMDSVRYGDSESFLSGDMLLVAGGVAAVVVIAALVVILCSVRRKRRQGKSKAAEQMEATPPEPAPETEFACPVCGGILHAGDPVCPDCGTPLAW